MGEDAKVWVLNEFAVNEHLEVAGLVSAGDRAQHKLSVVCTINRVVDSVVDLEEGRLRVIFEVGSARHSTALTKAEVVRLQVNVIVWSRNHDLLALVKFRAERTRQLEDVEASALARINDSEVDGLRVDTVDFLPVEVVPEAGLDSELEVASLSEFVGGENVYCASLVVDRNKRRLGSLDAVVDFTTVGVARQGVSECDLVSAPKRSVQARGRNLWWSQDVFAALTGEVNLEVVNILSFRSRLN